MMQQQSFMAATLIVFVVAIGVVIGSTDLNSCLMKMRSAVALNADYRAKVIRLAEQMRVKEIFELAEIEANKTCSASEIEAYQMYSNNTFDYVNRLTQHFNDADKKVFATVFKQVINAGDVNNTVTKATTRPLTNSILLIVGAVFLILFFNIFKRQW